MRYTQEVYPRPNILHPPRVWGKSTNEKDDFHKALPNVKNAYATLRKFTPVLILGVFRKKGKRGGLLVSGRNLFEASFIHI